MELTIIQSKIYDIRGVKVMLDYEYENNLLTNSLTFGDNVSADILNSGISIINTPINAVQTLYKEGVGGLVNSEIAGLKNAGNAIANEVSYTLTSYKQDPSITTYTLNWDSIVNFRTYSLDSFTYFLTVRPNNGIQIVPSCI